MEYKCTWRAAVLVNFYGIVIKHYLVFSDIDCTEVINTISSVFATNFIDKM